MVGKMHQKLPEDQEDGKYALLNGSSSHNHRDAKPSPLPGETIESTSDTSSTILTNKPLAKKVRPNFINLKNTSFPATSINGYADEASKVSNKMTSSAINGDCNNSGNIFAESSLSPTSSSVSRSSSNQELTAINGSIPISTLTRPEPSTDPVKDAVLPPKIISRFVSPDAANSPSDSLCSTDSTPWNIDGTETIVENPFKGGKGGAFQGLKKRTPSFIERELSALQEENKQLKASLKEAGRLNGQWRAYHEERQGYVERLLSTIHSLQQRHEPSSSPPGGGQK
ncbi:uncharacterized protein LOC108667436, partial [Hyalella azteca]|uniref:Uncharacterized protein LOC108667436 n=1 Tax=Hyalella azteca TaxID=294128 RepID=A0A8B7N9D3_HYAAZ